MISNIGKLEIYPEDSKHVKYCKELGNGWRLPTIEELKSIKNELNTEVFYWSSTKGRTVFDQEEAYTCRTTPPLNPTFYCDVYSIGFDLGIVRPVRTIEEK